MNISFCITAFDKDIHLLDKCLHFIDQQTITPEEILLLVSGVKKIPISKKISNIFTFEERLSAGKARNYLLNKASCEIVCFCDIDDEIHPQKYEIVHKIFLNTNNIAMVHDYNIGHQEFSFINIQNNIDFFCITDNDPNPNSTNLLCPTNGKITHGHISIRKNDILENKIRYQDKSHGEDGIFCRDILKSTNKNFVYCPLKLINYI